LLSDNYNHCEICGRLAPLNSLHGTDMFLPQLK
jgi:hypothetical protein